MAASLFTSKINFIWNAMKHMRFRVDFLNLRSYTSRRKFFSQESVSPISSDSSAHIYLPCVPVYEPRQNTVMQNYKSNFFRSIYAGTWNYNNNAILACQVSRGKKDVLKSQARWNSTGSNTSRSLPPLMDFPEIVWPSIIKSLRNRVLSTFIITPYFDREFRLPDFVQGSKQALQCVSNYLSGGDYKSLEGLVTDDALREIKQNMSSFSVEQRHELCVDKEDIYFSFPYQIGIMFNEDDKNQRRFVEITMVYHVLRGLKELRAQDAEPPINLGLIPEYQEKILLCNYRFIREFTKGIESQWTINVLNHFKPVDRLRAS